MKRKIVIKESNGENKKDYGEIKEGHGELVEPSNKDF
jgi:hypothetical protein